jgi:hypothetical protein
MSAVKLYDMATGNVETLERGSEEDMRRVLDALLSQDHSDEHVLYVSEDN